LPVRRADHAARIKRRTRGAMNEAAILEELAPLLRVRPELQSICRFGGQWASPHEPEPEGWAPFHIITAGACQLEIPTEAPVRLTAGDVAILPHGGPHIVKALHEAGGSAVPVRSLSRAFDSIQVKTNTHDEVETGLVCGRFHFEQANHNTVLAALPSLVVISASKNSDARRIALLIGTMQAELVDERIGAAAIATSLALAIMVIVLRTHLDTSATKQGVLALLARRHTAKALLGMLSEPARPWTLDHLAEHANTTRATLVRHFQAAVNMAPVAFLTELRLTIARGRIQASRTPLAVIAEDIGYQSETAFSRAYQRQFGVAPSGHRTKTTL
jgi:AraC family transcriptional activator of mtrCDE